MLRFTTRDLLWLTAVLALSASHAGHRMDVMMARVERDIFWDKLARDAGVIRQIQREHIRQVFNK